MNYRHAYHAGNHTEVFKHAVLTLVLGELLQKPGAFAVLDTHAGRGMYNLNSEEAKRTNEKSTGVEKVFGRKLASAPTYTNILHALNQDELTVYPGSPELVRRMLRGTDRLIACELHPRDGASLKRLYKTDGRVSVHQRDGYEAIGALLPPVERRGLVFIDPPFEQRNEVDLIHKALATGFEKWATGIFVVWYPIKENSTGVDVVKAAIASGFSKVMRAELCPFARTGTSLAGSGIVICNAPWKMDEKFRHLCEELKGFLSNQGGSWSVEVPRSG